METSNKQTKVNHNFVTNLIVTVYQTPLPLPRLVAKCRLILLVAWQPLLLVDYNQFSIPS